MTTIVEIFENFKGLLDFARQAVAIFEDYPIAALVVLGLGFLTAWWLRGVVDAGEIRGLNAQTEGLKKRHQQGTYATRRSARTLAVGQAERGNTHPRNGTGDSRL